MRIDVENVKKAERVFFKAVYAFLADYRQWQFNQ